MSSIIYQMFDFLVSLFVSSNMTILILQLLN